jgi:hypothetical protein
MNKCLNFILNLPGFQNLAGLKRYFPRIKIRGYNMRHPYGIDPLGSYLYHL